MYILFYLKPTCFPNTTPDSCSPGVVVGGVGAGGGVQTPGEYGPGPPKTFIQEPSLC